MKIHTPNNSILLSTIFLIAFNFGQGKDYDISGKVVDSSGEKVGKVTVLLLDKEDQRRYGLKIWEAFPKTINPIALSYATNNEIIKTEVLFS